MTLADHARIWVYQAERVLTSQEQATVRQQATKFTQQWVAHNQQLKAEAELLEDRFLVLAVDESMAGASGCSIDSSVHFVQQLGAQLGVDFFNRMLFSYKSASCEVQTVDRLTFGQRYAVGDIDDATIVFDPLVKTVGELRTQFEKPLAQSWHKRLL